MESLNEVNPNLICEKCYCKNIGIVRKGFSGQNAIIGFFVAGIPGGLLFLNGGIIIVGDPGLGIAIYGFFLYVLPLLGFFIGTVNMNNLYTVCMKCADKNRLQSEEEKRNNHWYGFNANAN